MLRQRHALAVCHGCEFHASSASSPQRAVSCRRNDLQTLNLVTQTGTACFGLVAMVAGIFGMNLSPLPIENTQVCALDPRS